MSTFTAGSTRPASDFSLCAEVSCDEKATVECLHLPGDGAGVWVPLCRAHLADLWGLEYLVESHGFLPTREADQ